MNKNKKEKLKSACEESDRRERVEKVAAILEAAQIHYKTKKEKAEAIWSFSQSKMDYPEIEFIANTLKPGYRTNTDYVKTTGVF